MPDLFYSDEFLKHETGQHPESPDRLRAITAYLKRVGTWEKLTHRTFGPATAEQLQRVHPAAYLQSVREYAAEGGGRIEQDTAVSPDSYRVAELAAGAAIAAVDTVLKTNVHQALCLSRPPGHHALANKVMGFCLLNNVAVAAEHARQHHQLDRVLIIDWDVHHGNGTQDIFYESDSVWFFSAHRFPFYPGSGDEDETGTGRGLGTTLNLPLKFGISRREYRERFTTMLTQVAEKSRPQLILLSAGFDAHVDDPIGSLGLETEDFTDLTHLVQQVAATHCEGRLVSLLEGGYDIQRLAECVDVHLQSLLAVESQPPNR